MSDGLGRAGWMVAACGLAKLRETPPRLRKGGTVRDNETKGGDEPVMMMKEWGVSQLEPQ